MASCEVDCGETLVEVMASRGAAIKASISPLSNPYGFEDLNMCCPHGVHWYAIPTGEQVALWRREATS